MLGRYTLSLLRYQLWMYHHRFWAAFLVSLLFECFTKYEHLCRCYLYFVAINSWDDTFIEFFSVSGSEIKNLNFGKFLFSTSAYALFLLLSGFSGVWTVIYMLQISTMDVLPDRFIFQGM